MDQGSWGLLVKVNTLYTKLRIKTKTFTEHSWELLKTLEKIMYYKNLKGQNEDPLLKQQQ